MGWPNSKESFDYNLDVLRGKVPGHSMISVQGHDNSVPNGGPFDLSPTFGSNSFNVDQSAIAAVPAVVGVASTDDTKDNVGNVGALTARVFGLDASGNSQINDVILTGQTEVFTADTFSAVTNITVLTAGSENDNAGTLYVGTGTFTSGIPAVRMLSMEIGHNNSFTGYYVVPTGKTLYLRQFLVTIATSNKDAVVHILIGSDGILWITRGEFGLEGGDLTTPVIAIPGLPAGTHLKLTAQGSAMSTNVTAILAGELVDD